MKKMAMVISLLTVIATSANATGWEQIQFGLNQAITVDTVFTQVIHY